MSQPEPIRRLLGRAPYLPTWHAMREFTVQRGTQTADELWLLEHDPVYTLGQAGRREHLIAPGVTPVVATDRGGQVTYHGPGQAIVYTLIDLRRLGITVRELVFRIEQAVIQTLEPFGVAGRSEEHTSELQSQSNLVCRLLLEKKNLKARTLLFRHQAQLRSHRA